MKKTHLVFRSTDTVYEDFLVAPLEKTSLVSPLTKTRCHRCRSRGFALHPPRRHQDCGRGLRGSNMSKDGGHSKGGAFWLVLVSLGGFFGG